jgi:membrane associated rhomboid family serine protease
MLSIPEQLVWNEYQIENSLKHLKVARNASVAIPFLGLAGFGLVTGGLIGIANDSDAGYICWSVGWACAIAGFTTSVISSIHISKTKTILEEGRGSVNVGVSSQGISLCFSW